MKNLFKIGVISALLVGSTYASDLLSSLTNGKISDNSIGVRILNLDEMKQVKGGYYQVETICFTDRCFAFADTQTAALNKTLTIGEEAAWRIATLEKDPATSGYFLGFMVKNNWAVSNRGQRYNYFTYSAVVLSPNGQTFQLSSPFLNNNLIVRQLSIAYQKKFEANFGGLQIKNMVR